MQKHSKKPSMVRFLKYFSHTNIFCYKLIIQTIVFLFRLLIQQTGVVNIHFFLTSSDMKSIKEIGVIY